MNTNLKATADMHSSENNRDLSGKFFRRVGDIRSIDIRNVDLRANPSGLRRMKAGQAASMEKAIQESVDLALGSAEES